MRDQRWLWQSSLAGLSLFVFIAAAHGDSSYDPYKVPKGQVVARVLRIVLEPVFVPHKTENESALRERVERLVTGSLQGGGFAVVASSEYDATWRRLAELSGGAFDPVTGEPTEKLAAVRELTARDLEGRLQTDATLRTGIQVDTMRFWGDALLGLSATGGQLTWRGGALHATPQRVHGTYFNAILRDNSGVELYSIRAPIEWTEIYAVRSYDSRPAAELYSETRLADAIRRALDALARVERPRATDVPVANPFEKPRLRLPTPRAD